MMTAILNIILIINFLKAEILTDQIKFSTNKIPPTTQTDLRPLKMLAWNYQEYRIIKKDEQGIVYDTLVHNDLNGWRVVKNDQKNGKYHFFLAGCSYTFGEGVNDEQTFASFISEKLNNAQTVNMGIRGASPVVHLYLWKNFNFKKMYPKDEGVMIYTHMPDHAKRVSLDWNYLDWAPANSPYFKRENDFIYQGIVADNYKFQFQKIINRLGLRYFWLRISTPTDTNVIYEQFRLEAQYLAALKKEYLRQFPKGHFYVTWMEYEFPFYPLTSSSLAIFIELMNQNGVEVIRPERDLEHPFNDSQIPRDGHPSVLAHQNHARSILNFINKNQLLK